MRLTIAYTLCAVFLAVSAAAAEAPKSVTVRMVGHGLRPADQFRVRVDVEYTIINAAKGTVEKRGDGGRVLEPSMVEYRTIGRPAPSKVFTVPADGEVPAAPFLVGFDRPIALVPGRLTALVYEVTCTRATAGADGKPKTTTIRQGFPVPLGVEHSSPDRCLIFEGYPGGALSIALRETCDPTR